MFFLLPFKLENPPPPFNKCDSACHNILINSSIQQRNKHLSYNFLFNVVHFYYYFGVNLEKQNQGNQISGCENDEYFIWQLTNKIWLTSFIFILVIKWIHISYSRENCWYLLKFCNCLCQPVQTLHNEFSQISKLTAKFALFRRMYSKFSCKSSVGL